MHLKETINIEDDSYIMSTFISFIQTYNLQYQKIAREISYKCHEATWILAAHKATGYGRTQQQAYKHALRNLIQLLIQKQQYQQFFHNQINNNQQPIQLNKTKSSFSKKSLITKEADRKSIKLSIAHSKINLNTTQIFPQQSGYQLGKAQQKLYQLEKYLKELKQQNQSLKETIQKCSSEFQRYDINDEKNKKNKIEIPKLKLTVLPNYHGNVQKSMNQDLLAQYNHKNCIKNQILIKEQV